MPSPISLLVRIAVVVVLLASAAAELNAQCQTTPTVTTPPVELWETLTPYPVAGDRQSDQNGNPIYNASHPAWFDADYAGGFMLASGFHGWDFFDVRTAAKKQAPQRIYGMDGWSWTSNYGVVDPRGLPLGFNNNDKRKLAPRKWIGYGELDTAGRDGALKEFGNKMYLASVSLAGLTVWEFDPAAWALNPGSPTSSGAAPAIIYAAEGTSFVDVSFAIAKNSGGADRLYLYASSDNRSRIYVFDISAAASSPCTQSTGTDVFANDVRQATSTCSSAVFKTTISGSTYFIATVDRQGSSPGYLVTPRVSGGTELFKLVDGANPQSLGAVRDSGESGDSNRFVRSVAAWRQGGTLAVASLGASPTTSHGGLSIHDVTNCAAAGNCNGGADRRYHDSSLTTQNAKERIKPGAVSGKTYLWTGQPTKCSGRPNKESLLDVTDLNNIGDLTPNLTQNIDGDTVNYFQYYYPENGSGFEWIVPGGAAFSEDGYLFRSMYQAVDTHSIEDPGPVLSVTGLTQTFHGDAVGYSVSASNCTPTSGWNWSTDEDSGANVLITNGTTSSPTITWVDTGITSDVIRVTNPGCVGVEGTHNVSIVDPTPNIVEVAINGTPIVPQSTVQVSQCSVQNFTTNTLGRAPLAYSWSITPAGTSSSSTTMEWSVGNASGLEALSLEASNQSGSDNFTANLNVNALPTLAFLGAPIVNQVGDSGTLTVDSNAAGDSEWRWEVAPLGSAFSLEADFGTGQEDQPFVLATGSWVIRATIRNCLDPMTESAVTSTIVVVANPPVPDFRASGPSGGCIGGANPTCIADVGTAVTFTDTSTGDITTYRYDFDHTGSTTATCIFGGLSPAPVNSHTYSTVGTYNPCLEADGPGGKAAVLSPVRVIITVANPPSISVSCSPSSVLTGQTSSCSATAQNCSAFGGGWSWQTAGGTGSSDSSNISLQWNTAGAKSVRATNSGCGTAQGSRTVTVSTGGGGGGDLNAVAVITPSSPSTGQSVTFNGTGSTGGVVRYDWSVRLNGSIQASYTGATAQHVFAAPGTYQVTLSVTDDLGCASSSCFDEEISTVVVTGGQSLVAAFSLTPSSPTQGENVVLNGGASFGEIVEYLWTIDPPTGPSENFSGQSVLYQFAAAGLHSVTLEVRDEAGCASADCRDTLTQTVTIQAAAFLAAKIRVLGDDPPIAGKFFTLDGSTSSGSPTSYSWEIDGQDIPGESLTLKFDEIGQVTVKLTVEKDGASDTATQVLQIVGDCDPDDDLLCLSDRRFKVEVEWTDFEANTGVGTPFDEGTADSGLFWFFQAANAEMLVKIIDACGFNNRYWFSLAATTNVAFTVRVTDVAANEVFEVSNPLGNPAQAVLDINAFATCDVAGRNQVPAVEAWYYPSEEDLGLQRAAAEDQLRATQQQMLDESAAWARETALRLAAERALGDTDLVATIEDVGTCVTDSTTFCFAERRFEVKVQFRDQSGATGPGIKAGLETDDSGVFYFFAPDNWEVLVKMVDGCGFNGHFWVFAAAATDQEFTLTLRDTVNGNEKIIFNPLATLAPSAADIGAFACE